VPLVGVITVWLSGFFDSIRQNVVPSGADTFCVLHEAIENHWPFATPPASSDRFRIFEFIPIWQLLDRLEAVKVAYGCTASVLALRDYNGLRVPLFELNRAPHILAQGAKR
jgi:hypothetical protein